MASSQAAMESSDGPGALSKFVRKASYVLKPRGISRNYESAEDIEIEVPAPVAEVDAAAAAAAVPEVPSPSDLPAIFESINVHLAGQPSVIAVPRPEIKDPTMLSKNQQEKAQVLFAKYGLKLDARDWTGPTRSGAQVEWVEKKVRVRVHRQCHHCGTSFGSAKECASCSHVRCKKCPRYEPKCAPPAIDASAPLSSSDVDMSDSSRDRLSLKQPPPPIHVQIDPEDQTEAMLQRPLSSTHHRRGADVVHRAPVHRVRRFCHNCEALFKGRSTICESCGHTRCHNCPREPAKPTKFPDGYPGDASEQEQMYPAVERVWRKPRHRVRYTCDQCDTVFPNSSERVCRSCKHERCANCARAPTRKTTKEQPEEVLRTLEGKLTGLQLLHHERNAGASDKTAAR